MAWNYTTGSGGSRLRRCLDRRTLDCPGFPTTERFLGQDGLKRTLATYNVKEEYGDARYVMVNTTGVHGGGVIRAVVRADNVFEILDEFSYPDPNVPDGVAPLVRWVYGQVCGTNIHGWVPRRADA